MKNFPDNQRNLILLFLSFLTLFMVVPAMTFAKKKPQETLPVVRTDAGLVQGFYQEGTEAFLGIPYARVERFMPPLPVTPWDTLMVADHWGPMTMQGMEERPKSEMSEDCCVLNVWTTDKTARKPVMLWLHGGGFDSGTSAWNPGMGLAKQDVVCVSINHRLNILGFLDLSAVSPKYKHSGNVGMLDVVAALKWIHRNIHLFGGDPTNITVFGESGGGGKVGTLLCMPEAKDLFHKAIILSGTILNVNNKEMTETLGKAVLSELGIDASNLEKLNDVPYRELYAAGQRAMAKSIGTRRPGTPMMWGFGPTPDGEVLMQQPFQPGFAKFADDKPIIIGSTFNELQRLTYDQPMTLQEARTSLQPTFGDDTDAYIQAFGEAWPNYKPQDLLSIDHLFRPKTIITADYVSSHRQTPVYMYMFTWKSPVHQGSVHGHELKFCFNTLNHSLNELPSPTADDQHLADLMSQSWSNFAHTGDPNAEGLPAWKPYTQADGDMMIFDYKCEIRHNPDRKLEEIINEHCFKQLKEFNEKKVENQPYISPLTNINPGSQAESAHQSDSETVAFSQYFEDNTLRLDYIFAGNDTVQHIYLEHLYKQEKWAGRKRRLEEKFLEGNGQLTVRDHQTQEVIYVWTFSTLFQEWLNDDEAKQVSRAFESSYNIPYPKAPVDVTITLTDKHQQVSTSLTHYIDPNDILIRPIGDRGIPSRYVWQGKTAADGSASLSDCIDIAILAEGYTAEQTDKFYADCERSVEALFAYEPFASMKDRFNVVAVAAPSRDAGPSVPHDGIWHDTPSHTHYDTFYTDRYLTSQDMHRIYDLLSGVPFEHIMVLINTDKYGGGGIYNQVTFASSDHPTFREVFIHEFGHSYGGLADEYAYDDMDTEWYPSDTEPWEPNITTLHDFPSKWADLLPQGRPVPTPLDPAVPDFRTCRDDPQKMEQLNACTQVVGVFEGAGYQTHGCYRPAQECRMKINEVRDFCPVCNRAIRDITDFYTGK